MDREGKGTGAWSEARRRAANRGTAFLGMEWCSGLGLLRPEGAGATKFRESLSVLLSTHLFINRFSHGVFTALWCL